MSEIKVGDKVKVRNAGRGTDGWVGDVVSVRKKIFTVSFKDEGHVIDFYESELEIVPPVKSATPPTHTKMLYELITLAKAGVKFKAKQGETILDSCGYTLNANSRWTTDEVLTPWKYEEIKEPRVVEFECGWVRDPNNIIPTNCGSAVLEPLLTGTRWKIVATEVIE